MVGRTGLAPRLAFRHSAAAFAILLVTAGSHLAAAQPKAEPLPATRAVVDAAVGWTFASPTLDPTSPPDDAEEAFGELDSGSGFAAELGIGLRRTLTRRFDGRLRLAFAFAAIHGTARYTADNTGGAQPFYEDGTSDVTFIELGPAIEAAIRLRPILTVPWYIGIGPRLGPTFVVGSADVPVTRTTYGVLGGGTTAVSRSVGGKPHFVLEGLLESGVLLGKDERWDIGARLLAGVENDGSAVFRLLAGAGWSF